MLPDNVHLDQNVSGLHLPVELPPLVPEGEAVSLQPVPVDLAYEVGGAALVAAAADGVLAAGGDQVTLQTCEGGCVANM